MNLHTLRALHLKKLHPKPAPLRLPAGTSFNQPQIPVAPDWLVGYRPHPQFASPQLRDAERMRYTPVIPSAAQAQRIAYATKGIRLAGLGDIDSFDGLAGIGKALKKIKKKVVKASHVVAAKVVPKPIAKLANSTVGRVAAAVVMPIASLPALVDPKFRKETLPVYATYGIIGAGAIGAAALGAGGAAAGATGGGAAAVGTTGAVGTGAAGTGLIGTAVSELPSLVNGGGGGGGGGGMPVSDPGTDQEPVEAGLPLLPMLGISAAAIAALYWLKNR